MTEEITRTVGMLKLTWPVGKVMDNMMESRQVQSFGSVTIKGHDLSVHVVIVPAARGAEFVELVHQYMESIRS